MARIWPAYGPHMGRVGTSHTHAHTHFFRKKIFSRNTSACVAFVRCRCSLRRSSNDITHPKIIARDERSTPYSSSYQFLRSRTYIFVLFFPLSSLPSVPKAGLNCSRRRPRRRPLEESSLCYRISAIMRFLSTSFL